MIAKQTPIRIWTALLAAICTSGAALADEHPITGVPVSGLEAFDDAVMQVMTNTGLMGCTVGVMKDDCVVYQRGFGWRDEAANVPMPENATMRLASVTKVLTKRAIHLLEADGLDLADNVFDVGQAEGGILDLEPFLEGDDEFDVRVGQITVDHLMEHEAGWATDYSWSDIDAYNAMGLSNPPPNIADITRYAMGKTLADDPGDTYAYSNFGFNVLMLVIEERSGQSFSSYVSQHVLTKNMWVPSTDLFPGLPFSQTGLREPHYFSEGTVTNVYDLEGPAVAWPYGGFNVEGMLGSTSMVASAAPMLTFASLYPERWIGSMPGSSTRILTSSNDSDVHIVVLCNERFDDESSNNWAGDTVALAIDAVIGDGVTWPTTCIDGQWVGCLGHWPGGNGSYNNPYKNMPWALFNMTAGTKLLLHPGDYAWTGVLDKKLLLDAPLGAARLGMADCD